MMSCLWCCCTLKLPVERKTMLSLVTCAFLYALCGFSRSLLAQGRVMFITDDFTSRQALFAHRGIQPAALLNASWSTCDEACAVAGGGSVRVYVHVKSLCTRLMGLPSSPISGQRGNDGNSASSSGFSGRKSCRREVATPPQAYHVYDVVDATASTAHMHAISRHVDAIVMSTAEDLRENCRSRLCVRIPHHYNLNCSVRARPAAVDVGTNKSTSLEPRKNNEGYEKLGEWRREIVLGMVGTLKRYGTEFAPLAAAFAEEHVVVRREAAYKSPCAFFADIDIALAWSNPKHTSRRDLLRKPAERFTNPIVLNIPTIGSDALASFHLHSAVAGGKERGESRPFLCSSAADVLPLVLRIARGELEGEFTALRRQVLADVSTTAMMHRYASLLTELTRQPPVCTTTASFPAGRTRGVHGRPEEGKTLPFRTSPSKYSRDQRRKSNHRIITQPS